jgi:serine/threonine protein kinase
MELKTDVVTPSFRVLRKIGQGSFGQVFEAMWRDQVHGVETRVALKQVAVRGPTRQHRRPF